MKKILLTIVVLAFSVIAVLAQSNPRILTAIIMQISTDQVVIRLRGDSTEKTLNVDPASVKVTFKYDGEATEGSFADLRERMFCNILLDEPDGLNAKAFVVNGRKPDDGMDHGASKDGPPEVQ